MMRSIGAIAMRLAGTLRGERPVPWRYVLICLGAALLMLGSEGAGLLQFGIAPSPLLGFFTALGSACGLLLLIAAGMHVNVPAFWQRFYTHLRPRERRRLHQVALVGMLMLTLDCLVIFAGSTSAVFDVPFSLSYRTDVIAFNYVNAQLVLNGHNPYTSDWAFRMALQRFPHAEAPPLRRGAFGTGYDNPPAAKAAVIAHQFLVSPQTGHGEYDPRTLHSYPALAFLLYVPLLWAGVDNILYLHLLIFWGLFAWLLWLAPVGWRHWGALASASAVLAVSGSLLSETEVFCAAFLLLAWHYREHRWGSAALLGLGCAFKQFCWFFAPLFILDAWLTHGWREAAKRAAITVALFLLPNLPFLVLSPRAWWDSLWLPMSDPMFPSGLGIIALSSGHLLPYGTPAVYTALELLALLGGLWAFRRWRGTLGDSVLLLGFLPLFFAAHSLPNYFAFAPWMALYAVNRLLSHERAVSPATGRIPAPASPENALAPALGGGS